MTQQPNSFALTGGMDLVTPELQKPPGCVVASLNYEPVANGYRRFSGFERFDGQAPPSAVTGYDVVHFTAGGSDLTSIVAGTQLRNSGAPSWRAVAVAPPVITAGSAGAGTAVGYLGVSVTVSTGVPLSGFMRIAPTTNFGTYASLVSNEAVAEAAAGAWLRAAIEARRLAILPLPGSGPVRGVWFHADKVLAVRDNAGGTAGIMNYANRGWQPVNLSTIFTFNSGGTNEPAPGDQATGATSGAVGTIKAIDLTSGAWASGTAAGQITIQVATGTFQNGENIDVVDLTPFVAPAPSWPNTFTLTNAGTAYVLPPGGRYKFLNHNFFGASNLRRAYGVNGVGKAFEFDDLVVILSPISTGMVNDSPTDIGIHKQSLFLGFRGGSLQFSQVGYPSIFDPILGAGEIGIGGDFADIISGSTDTLAILGVSSINVLYGDDKDNFVLSTLNRDAGALPFSAQKLSQVIYLDNAGLRSLSATQAYGNFSQGSMSRLISPLLEDYRKDQVQPVASWISRQKNQYWLMFDNGTGIAMYVEGKKPAILPINLGKVPTCSCSVEVDGQERIFFGDKDGYVYEFNKGTSLDGQPIEHYLRLPFFAFGSSEVAKRLHKVKLECEAQGPTTLSAAADLDYGSVLGLEAMLLDFTFGGGAIDDLGSNEQYFASQLKATAETYLDGWAANISLKISGETTYEEPHTLTGVTYHVSPRGLKR